jgi:hypothetical protein
MRYFGTLVGLLRETYWEMSRISDIVAAGAVPCPIIPGDEVRARGGARARGGIQREGAELQIRGIRSAGPGDDQARFLADLRALRDSAAIGHDELAARAHYPTDILQEAENGPRLPGLPILTAYVRACDGDVLDWEERWRQLNAEVPEDLNLPVRPPGASAAAVAGARAGVSVAPPDVYDPDRIRAALRGGHGPLERASHANGGSGLQTPTPGAAGIEVFADGAGPDPAAETAGAPWDAESWDAGATPTITTANGNHSTESGSQEPFGSAYTEAPYTEAPYTDGADNGASVADPAGSIAPAHDENSAWLAESTPEPGSSGAALAPGDSDFDWLRPPGAAPDARSGENNVMWSEAEAQSAAAPAEPVMDEPRPWQQDSIMKPPQREDFWTTPGPAPSDLQPPAVSQASWAAAGEAAPSPPATSEVPPLAAQGPAHAPAQAQAAVPQPRKPDRLLSVKLIVVIIIAALIGSALVLLLQ